MTRDDVIIDLDHACKSFRKPNGGTLLVLDDINVDVREGEVVALLGRSGCGKSTLLRIMAGLVAPSDGAVRYRNAELVGANPGTAMVFQNFALMPWLTVQKNVELGLAARKVAPAERGKRALEAIDLIGLDGFESAYPKELSGGMRQRVGFARALVLQPDLLLMDEPFSALDVLTAENLRNELMSLWAGQDFPTKAICLVTHNIEEAIILADRIIVLGSNPGRVVAELPINLERPRDRHAPAFQALVDELYGLLTGTGPTTALGEPAAATPATHPLPKATVGGLAGLVEIVHGKGGRVGIADIVADLGIDAKALFPLIDAAALLDFVRVSGVEIELTSAGRDFTTADIQVSKQVFAQQARTRAPLVRTICNALQDCQGSSLRASFFLDILQQGFNQQDAQEQLDIAVGWGRYAELFDYDIHTDLFTLEAGASDGSALGAATG
ncbi:MULTISPECIES: ABC transporter ATP-binding protein [Mycobacterium]|uniref:ABC transporter ATP-binding protein n=1 Tax=Mycobacterium kiyosense TaxID=2871094 RepID=A0A9P3Q648_9MYCO|nr:MULTISPECIES: nitrate/sulfonate/bicarbonate ABC transporter ATP-binding protein [Mycobacterium]BDB43339.1 ABC transporter ATP-binding protein [Mycobacterium kiyosense]BDE13494.1 ABC transporter ATP-binding protein [Mycobacterium sp. 20KCMC460]GLB84168.1 ABC transporter ATP-binding protein [Mycobacterium kiyosense]GLB88426.1 ABC transporter ATP-binding protein [Mycobacterium kiyosense]GLB94648.1 ABC transporter ATP-binding protein [Mycobacterium kiyosense]